MAAIEIANRGSAARVSVASRALARAATAALAAPSIFNSQPWRWRIDGDVAELWGERRRQVQSIDPDGRMLALSCGAALHYARVALAADGYEHLVTRTPDPDRPDLLATIRLSWADLPGLHHAEPEVLRLFRAMSARRTDRRPFADLPVPASALDRLRAAAEANGAHLQFATAGDVVTLAVAAGHASTVELADPAYRRDLAASEPATWVAADDARPVARPVPLRVFDPELEELAPLPGAPAVLDRHARYAILFTDGDGPADWVAAGEALSAVLLTATSEGLATSPMSDLVEVGPSRALLRGLLAGVGYPAIVVRIGRQANIGQPPARPARRSGHDAIEYRADR